MEPCPWVLATGEGPAMTAEFAYHGNMPAAGLSLGLAAGPVRTALFTASAEDPHPALGRGVYLRLTLPIEVSGERAITMARELNQAETHELTFSQFMGAWCSAPRMNSISFVTFLPVPLSKPETLKHFIWSMRARCEWVKQYLSAN